LQSTKQVFGFLEKVPDLPSHLQEAFLYRLRWMESARDNQLPPSDNYQTWLILAGRGFGKTRTGAEESVFHAIWNPGIRCAVVAPTIGDVRDICFEGESGILNCLPESMVVNWNRSLQELTLVNGSRIKGYTAERPDRLRGPQHHFAWADELASWQYPEAWDQLLFGLRLKYPDGRDPAVVISTTPRPIKIIKDLVAQAKKSKRVFLTTGSTFENAENLSPAMLETLKRRYENTRLGRQELYAEILDEVVGALWTHELLDRFRMGVEEYKKIEVGRTVVGVDPAVSVSDQSDETGIVVVSSDVMQLNAFVLKDGSVKESPARWAARAVELFYTYRADCIVAEVNNGGDLVEQAIRTVDPNVPVRKVWASRGKHKRAEPVAALYEQGRVHHVGVFPTMEEQMCATTTEGFQGEGSPDRMDAAVWAITELLLPKLEDKPKPRVRIAYV